MAPHGFGGISLETRQQGREEFYQMEKPHLHTTPVLVPSDKNLPGTNRPSPQESTPPTPQLPHRILSDEMGHADAPGIAPHLVVAPLFCAPQRDTRRSLPNMVPLGNIIRTDSENFGENTTTPAQYPYEEANCWCTVVCCESRAAHALAPGEFRQDPQEPAHRV
jgi:hypothetical protein